MFEDCTIPAPNDITSGCARPENTAPLPDWEGVLFAAARLPKCISSDAELVGRCPIQIPGDLEGTEADLGQLVRDELLETSVAEYHGERITVRAVAGMLRIKGISIPWRNAGRNISIS